MALFDFASLDSGEAVTEKVAGAPQRKAKPPRQPPEKQQMARAEVQPAYFLLSAVESRRQQRSAELLRLSAAKEILKQAPQMLKLTSPNGQKDRAGIYVLDEEEFPHGMPLWRHAHNNNLIYPMLNGRWGVATQKEYKGGNSNLAYIFCPTDHGGLLPHQLKCPWKYWSGSSWVVDKELSIKVAQDANAPRLTLQDCMLLEDELIAEYDKPEFQRRFCEAWAKADGDGVRQREARVLMCLPVQIKVIQKYGFEPSLKGVQQSVRAFQPFDEFPQLMQRSDLMTWLVNPSRQACQQRPSYISSSSNGHVGFEHDRVFEVVARLISGQELAKIPMRPADTFCIVREAVENALGGVPLKLVHQGKVLTDGQTAGKTFRRGDCEVNVVFLNYKALTSAADGAAKLVNVTSGASETSFLSHAGAVRSAALSGDRRLAATACADGTARLFDVETAECRFTLQGHRKAVNSVAFSPSDADVLTASDDGYVKIYDRSSGHCRRTFPNGGECVNSAVFSPTGEFLLLASADGAAKLMKASSGAHEMRFGGHRDAVNSASFSESGLRVVTASDDCTAKVFEVATGACVALLLGHTRPVNTAVFAQDGQRVLSASDDCTVRLFDVVTGGCVQLFQVDDQRATSALFLPDEHHVLVASGDHALRLFHIRSGECQKVMKVHEGAVHSLCFY